MVEAVAVVVVWYSQVEYSPESVIMGPIAHKSFDLVLR